MSEPGTPPLEPPDAGCAPPQDSGAPSEPQGTSLPSRRATEVPARILAAQFDLLRAWQRVSEKSGMPGVDGVSVRRFGLNHQAWLRALQARLAGDRYLACPLRLAELEKKSGGQRLLLVPTVADRIVQAAVTQWLTRRWNAAFDPASFGYRPGLGVHDALRAIAALRDRGFRWVLDADIRSFFDSIDHARLFATVDERLGGGCAVSGWVRQWVAAAVWDGAELRRLPRGVPQGSPISPLLANLFLDSFDHRLREAGVPLVRYADDFIVLGRTPFDLAQSRRLVEEILTGLDLALNTQKTRVRSVDQTFRFLGAEIRADSILLPFDKKKTPKRPSYVAPVMPRALLSAFRAGHLAADRPFDWAPTGRQAVASGSPEDRRRARALGRLSGGPVGPALSSLKGTSR